MGERFALERLTLRFLGTEALVLPEADPEPERLSLLLERLLAQVRGLERLEAWREFLGRAQGRWEEVGYLGFSLLLFRRSQAATPGVSALVPGASAGRAALRGGPPHQGGGGGQGGHGAVRGPGAV